ncbi:MAG: 50S ribosomal protein L23 [Candidatus Jacksonbacteria bacterium]
MAIIDKLKNKLLKKAKKPADKKKTDAEKKSISAKIAKSAGIGRLADVLIKPIVTEKSTNLSGQNKYVFLVNNRANKNQIIAAIKAVYQIKPTLINIINKKGKKVKFGKIQGQRKDIKKAIVTLPKGKKLDIYEGV